MTIKLTTDQSSALAEIRAFLMGNEKEFLLTGGSGSGKSTLMSHVLSSMEKFESMAVALDPNHNKLYEYHCCATTNEAAKILSEKTGYGAETVFKKFKLFLSKNYKTGNLDINTSKAIYYNQCLLLIDEVSMLSDHLREVLNTLTSNSCKIIYLGDKEQLDAVKAKCTVFDEGLPSAHLTTNNRNNNDIGELGLLFKDAVISGKLPVLNGIDTDQIKYVNGDQFRDLIERDFDLLQEVDDKRIITYTNERAIEYNNFIRAHHNKGGYIEGEQLFTNEAIMSEGTTIAPNNALVTIKEVTNDATYQGLSGTNIKIEYSGNTARGFIPNDAKAAKKVLKELSKAKAWSDFFNMQEVIFDLRPRFASTSHKTQGSTLKTVYVDLNDIATCYSVKTIARLLYVGITRATDRVYLYGSL